LTLTLKFWVACAPANFDGGAGMQPMTKKIDPPTDNPDNTADPDSDPTPPAIPPEKLQVLTDCAKKAGLNLLDQSTYTVETADINISIANRATWKDTLAATAKSRVLILNIQGQIANRIAIELGNPKTIYCLNLKSQIVNRLDVAVSKTAQLIDVYQTQITNRVSRHQI
jgi:hypothetical protein